MKRARTHAHLSATAEREREATFHSLASKTAEKRGMVLQVADASARQQHQQAQRGCGDGQRQLREGRGTPPGAVQRYLLARQQPGVLNPTVEKTHNASRGAGGNFATVNVEEALANIWAIDDVEAGIDGGTSLLLPAPLCRKADEALLEIRRDQPRLQQCRSSQNAHGHHAFWEVSHENSTKAEVGREGVLGPCSYATQPLDQHPPHQQQLQNQYGNGMPTYPMANEQQRYDRIIGIGDGNYDARSSGPALDSSGNGTKTASNYCGGGPGFGGDWGGGITGGQMGAASPKSSISSDGSGGDMVGYSPAAVWEVDMRRGASKCGVGGGGCSGGGGRRRPLDAADEDPAGLWQPQMNRSSEASARFSDRKQSMDVHKQLFPCANMELETPLGRDKEDMLLQLLKITSSERDEARDQLQMLLTKIAQANPPEQSPTHFHPDPLLIGRTRSNFDSPSQTTHGHQPYVSSTLFDPASPPELLHKIVASSSNAATAQQPAPLPECASSMSPGSAEFDPASAIIDRLVMKRALPEKGKLLQAVMEAGPLLQTLLVAGSLPRWRNPPPLQPFQVPPVSVSGREAGILNQNAVLSQSYLVQSSPTAFQHQNSLVASQIYAASSLGSSGLRSFCLRAPSPSTCAGSYQRPVGKRQKF